MRKRPALKLLAVFLCLILCCTAGCISSTIREDPIYEELPPIDPEDGVARDKTVDLYFRVGMEPYLVRIERNISVRANEKTEMAVLRALLEGPPALSNNLTELFPEGTSVVSISLDGGILYVTMSSEFLDVMPGASSREEIDAARRLSVLAIVNSLLSLNSADKVLILVDIDDTGVGSRVQGAMLGFPSSENADSQLMEPLEMDESAVIDAGKLAECTLAHIRDGNYERAYPYFAESESGGQQKPDYAAFETEMKALGTLTEFSVKRFEEAENGLSATAIVDIVFVYGDDGVTKKITSASLPLYKEGDLMKLGYASFRRLLER